MTTEEQRSHLWDVWVGSQSPLDFAHGIQASAVSPEKAIEAYCRAMNAQEPADQQATDDQIAEAVSALLVLSQRALEEEQRRG
ncbi:MAG: hypothetical protein ABFD77_00090 [Thermotogota bacterium]